MHLNQSHSKLCLSARYLLDGLLLCVVAGPEVDTKCVDDQLAVVRVRDVVNLPAIRSE